MGNIFFKQLSKPQVLVTAGRPGGSHVLTFKRQASS